MGVGSCADCVMGDGRVPGARAPGQADTMITGTSGRYWACCKMLSAPTPGARRGHRRPRHVPPAAGEPPTPRFTYLLVQLEVNVADPGYAVDPGVYGAPDQPHNPDPPRYPGSPAWPGAAREVMGAHEAGGAWEGRGLLRLARQRDIKILQRPLFVPTCP